MDGWMGPFLRSIKGNSIFGKSLLLLFLGTFTCDEYFLIF